MMYKQIEAQLVSIGMTKREMAQQLGIGYNTLLLKLKGDSKFTLDEALAIKKLIQSEESIERLFERSA
ncbi:hypothetical protein [Candidatus Soleaferrea massiliensis]|uniref:hypothetical protein n=1 Tax=Candidatus Soleaferrea massiliensis TaxID=1470354 RepID=UPI00069403DC|nr:hypothetical protein [Candidatus Soleaferrea massiliensis]